LIEHELSIEDSRDQFLHVSDIIPKLIIITIVDVRVVSICGVEHSEQRAKCKDWDAIVVYAARSRV